MKSEQMRSRKAILMLALPVLALLSPATGGAQEQVVLKTAPRKQVTAEVNAGLGYLFGDTTYQIGGRYVTGGESAVLHFPVSELKWPMNVVMASVGGHLMIQDKLELRLQLAKNITTGADKMEDSDWTDLSRPGRKTIYSESDNECKVWNADLGARYWLVSTPLRGVRGLRVALGLGAGLLYEKSDWEASNLNQVSVDPGFPNAQIPGVVGTYKNTLIMPYIDLAGKLTYQQFEGSASLGIAPYATVNDEDDHLLRYKLSKIDTSGTALKLALEGRYNFKRNCFILARLEALSYDMDGTQEQSYYAGPLQGDTASIDAKVKSVQTLLTLGAGCRF